MNLRKRQNWYKKLIRAKILKYFLSYNIKEKNSLYSFQVLNNINDIEYLKEADCMWFLFSSTSNSIEKISSKVAGVAVLRRWFRSDRFLLSSLLQYLSFSFFRVIARRYTEFRIRPGEFMAARLRVDR